MLSVSEVHNQVTFYIIAITLMSIVIFQEDEASGKFTRRCLRAKEVHVCAMVQKDNKDISATFHSHLRHKDVLFFRKYFASSS